MVNTGRQCWIEALRESLGEEKGARDEGCRHRRRRREDLL
jgi:hypothetical protein